MSDEHLTSSDLRAISAMSLGTVIAGLLSLPAALSAPPGESSVARVLFVGGLICGGASWSFIRRANIAYARSVLTFGFSITLGLAALLAIDYPALWVGVICAYGLWTLMIVWLQGRARLRAWALGGLGLWLLTILLSRGTLGLLDATLALMCLLAADAIAWLLVTLPIAGHTAIATVSPALDATQPTQPTDSTDGTQLLAGQVKQAIKELNQSAGTIHNVMVEQLANADRQSGALSDIASTLEDYQESTDQLKQLTEAMSNTADDLVQHADQGKEVAAGAIMGLEHIRSQVKAIALNLVALVRHTESIGEIISSLADLATQSNFLALNASIEAARAGQHGRGFAVVADEIRDLAQQSTESAEQVRSILVEIRQAVHQTASATETGADGVDTGVSRVTDTAQAVGLISHHVVDSTSKAQQIGAMLDAQAAEIREAAASLKSVNQMQMQYLASTRMAEALSKSLLNLAQRLDGAVAQKDDIEAGEEAEA